MTANASTQRVKSQAVQFSPSALIAYVKSPFRAWMDRAHRIDPKHYVPDEIEGQTQLLFDKGMTHEEKYLAHLKEQYLSIAEIAQDEQSINNTLDALRSGVDVVFQAHLSHENFHGYADFLFKTDKPSILGDFSYTVGDTKLSGSAKAEHLLQMCVYAEILQAVQGVRPQNISVIVRDFSEESFPIHTVWDSYLELKQRFLDFQHNFDINNPPEPTPGNDWGRWQSHGEKILEEQDHLIRVANITKGQIKKLGKETITTLKGLAESTLDKVPKLSIEKFRTLQRQAQLQIKTQETGKPAFEVKPYSEAGRGLSMLPPESSLDIYFDIEGDPLIIGGLEYLFGVTYLDDKGEMQFKDWSR